VVVSIVDIFSEDNSNEDKLSEELETVFVAVVSISVKNAVLVRDND
jgi:hypothetical protein